MLFLLIPLLTRLLVPLQADRGCLCDPEEVVPPQGLGNLTASAPGQYSSFPIFDEVVIQNFRFDACVPVIAELNDAFCTGNWYQVYDNFEMVESGKSILNFCGISGIPLQPIVKSPVFTRVEFLLDPGTHFFTVVIFHSPIGGGRTSMRVTLKPQGCCDTDDPDISIGGIEEQCIFAKSVTPGTFSLADHLQVDGTFKGHGKCKTGLH